MAPLPMNLSGKTALVTGGERGIGRGIVKELLRHGMRVCIAGMTAFLLSEEAGFITGQNIVVDGGMTRKMIYHH